MVCFYVYILRCRGGSYYVGHTDDLEKRLSEHMLGLGRIYTSKRRPVELVFQADFPSRDDAFMAERQIKGWTKKKKEALIGQDWEILQSLSKKKFGNVKDNKTCSLK